jgi:hypothetical protein
MKMDSIRQLNPKILSPTGIDMKTDNTKKQSLWSRFQCWRKVHYIVTEYGTDIRRNPFLRGMRNIIGSALNADLSMTRTGLSGERKREPQWLPTLSERAEKMDRGNEMKTVFNAGVIVIYDAAKCPFPIGNNWKHCMTTLKHHGTVESIAYQQGPYSGEGAIEIVLENYSEYKAEIVADYLMDVYGHDHYPD